MKSNLHATAVYIQVQNTLQRKESKEICESVKGTKLALWSFCLCY